MYNSIDLEIFITISKTLNLSQAALQLNMAQSTISKRLKELEIELGTTLIERGQGIKTLQLTKAGENFLKIANEMNILWSRAQDLNSSAPKTSIAIASLSSLNYSYLPKLYSLLQQHEPKLDLNIITSHSPQVYDLVDTHQADIGFSLVEKIYPTILVERWFSEPLVVLRVKSKKYSPGTIFRPEDLAPNKEVYYCAGSSYDLWHEQWWPSSKNSNIKLDSVNLIYIFLREEDQWCIVPLSVAQILQRSNKYAIYSLAGTPPYRTCYVLTHKNPTSNNIAALNIIRPYLQLLSKTVLEKFKQ